MDISGKLPMGLGIPPFEVKSLPESIPLKSRFLVCGLTVAFMSGIRYAGSDWAG